MKHVCLQTGALVRLMHGEDFSSTDLHLAADDTLLVGQVAEMTPIEGQDPNKAASVHHRKLQVGRGTSGRSMSSIQLGN